jgi:hypothetical protein
VGTVNSHALADDDPILLYSSNNLELGDHTMVITVQGASYPNVCEVDKFVYVCLLRPWAHGGLC